MKTLIWVFVISLVFGQTVRIPLGPDAVIYLHDIVLLILTAVSLWHVRKKKTFRVPLHYRPVLAFVLAGFVSLIVNSHRVTAGQMSVSFLYLVRWVGYSLVYIIVVQRLSVLKTWLAGLFASGVLVAFLGIFQFFYYPDLRNLFYLGWDPHYYRVFSTFFDPNFAGIIFVCTVFLGFYFYFQKNRLKILGITLIPFVALILTFSRSSYAAFFAGSVALAYMQKKLKYLGLLFTIFIVFFFAIPNPGKAYLHMDRKVSSMARLENWKESVSLIQKSPIFGYGFNTLRYINQGPYTDTIVSHARAGVDNSFLFILATTGLFGLGAYGWMLVSVFKAVLTKTVNFRLSMFRHAVFAVLIAVIIHSQFVNSLFYPQVMIWMWILIGICERETDITSNM